MKIDSITIDSKKLKILEHDESKLICSFMNANPGTFKIKLYQNEKEFILKKDIHFIQMEYKEPSKDNIYFLPDTIYLQENNPEIEFTLYGSDFEQYKIDKVYLNSQQCWIVKEFRDSLQVQCQYSLLGNTTISFLYKGTKISLDKNLVINIKDSPLNLSFNNVVSLEFRDIRTLVRHFSSSRIGPDYTHVTIDSSMVTNNLKKDTLVDLIDANFAIPFILTRVINNPNGGSEFSISIDTDAKLIKHFSFSSYSYFSSFEKQTESKYSYGFENLPYTIVENNGKTKIVAEVFGKEVEKYYPLLKFYSYNRDGNNTQYINENMSITKKDTTTGREINYFPATNSSYIKITIGN